MCCSQVSWVWLTFPLSDSYIVVRYGPCLKLRTLLNVLYPQIKLSIHSKYIRIPYERDRCDLALCSVRYFQLSSLKYKYATNTRPKWTQILSNIGASSFSNITGIPVFNVNSFPKPRIEPMYRPSLISLVSIFTNKITYLFGYRVVIVPVGGLT